MSRSASISLILLSFGAGAVLGGWWMRPERAEAASNRLFELRTYTVFEGRLDALNARFRNHTRKLFEKQGIRNVGYWTPADGPDVQKKLVYLISHADKSAAEKSWAAFRADPEWQKVKETSEKDGKIVDKVESLFLTPTDYSAIR